MTVPSVGPIALIQHGNALNWSFDRSSPAVVGRMLSETVEVQKIVEISLATKT
jgi:hypothetical protein